MAAVCSPFLLLLVLPLLPLYTYTSSIPRSPLLYKSLDSRQSSAHVFKTVLLLVEEGTIAAINISFIFLLFSSVFFSSLDDCPVEPLSTRSWLISRFGVSQATSRSLHRFLLFPFPPLCMGDTFTLAPTILFSTSTVIALNTFADLAVQPPAQQSNGHEAYHSAQSSSLSRARLRPPCHPTITDCITP